MKKVIIGSVVFLGLIIVTISMVAYSLPKIIKVEFPNPSAPAFVKAWGTYGSANGQLIMPMSIVTDSYGNVYVYDSGNQRIQKFDSKGKFLVKWNDKPIGMAVARNDRIYAVANGGNMGYYDTNGNPYALGPPLNKQDFPSINMPKGIAAIDDSLIFVATDYYVGQFACSGQDFTFIRSWGGEGAGLKQFDHIDGIATDNKRVFIYVADGGNRCIKKFDSKGEFIKAWGSDGTGPGKFKFPSGIAVGPDSNVYVCDAINNCVQVFDPDGNFITKWGKLGSGNGEFNGPNSVAVHGGFIYVSDYTNNRIQMFTKLKIISPKNF